MKTNPDFNWLVLITLVTDMKTFPMKTRSQHTHINAHTETDRQTDRQADILDRVCMSCHVVNGIGR